jgi:hypothetical protein
MGAAVGRVARALGTPLMPWQQLVADVGGEVDDRGRFVHSTVIVTVPRQSGKTTLMLAQSVQRCLMAPRRKTWHTAQTGQAARTKWRELADATATSPLAELLAGRPRRAAGSEALLFANGSALRPHPPTRDGLHGEQSDHNDVDEPWAYDEQQGDDVMQAIEPTQATRPGAQTWLWSTRGDRSSTWFHGMINRAYAGEPGFALFDFGIPDDLEPTDENMAAYHPALGFTIELETITRSTLPPGEKARAYGNRATGAGERVIPLEPWLAARTDTPLPPGRPAYGVAVAADGSAGAVAAAVLGPDGVPWVEVIEHRPGRSWLVERVRGLRDQGQGVAADRLGPAAPVADQLELAGVELLPLARPDYAAACQDLFDRVTDPAGPRVRHRQHAALDEAADIAGKRLGGDGGWVWSRTRSAGDISALEATTLAAWAVLRNPPQAPAPRVYFG